MKINIGSGGIKIDGFQSCDHDPLAEPDHLFDLEKDPFPFESDSVETVVAHHVLEHLGEGYFHCLKELYRVCQHGAQIDIRVPHHRHDYFHNDPTHRRPITVDGLTLFSKKYNRICRAQKAASSRLGDYFDVDFEVVSWDYVPSARYREEFDGKPKEEVEKYLSEHSNIIEEVWIRVAVIKQ